MDKLYNLLEDKNTKHKFTSITTRLKVQLSEKAVILNNRDSDNNTVEY